MLRPVTTHGTPTAPLVIRDAGGAGGPKPKAAEEPVVPKEEPVDPLVHEARARLKPASQRVLAPVSPLPPPPPPPATSAASAASAATRTTLATGSPPRSHVPRLQLSSSPGGSPTHSFSMKRSASSPRLATLSEDDEAQAAPPRPLGRTESAGERSDGGGGETEFWWGQMAMALDDGACVHGLGLGSGETNQHNGNNTYHISHHAPPWSN